MRDLLHCQLQAGGWPSLLESSNPDLLCDVGDILARFDEVPVCDEHDEPFFQDGGDDDGY